MHLLNRVFLRKPVFELTNHFLKKVLVLNVLYPPDGEVRNKILAVFIDFDLF